MPKTDSPYVVGIHAPMQSELTLQDLAVTGSIPVGLNGRYLKMGANPVSPDPAGHHWFLGDGMVHGIAIQDGRVLRYRNRWIRSRLAAAALGRAPSRPMATRNSSARRDSTSMISRLVAASCMSSATTACPASSYLSRLPHRIPPGSHGNWFPAV